MPHQSVDPHVLHALQLRRAGFTEGARRPRETRPDHDLVRHPEAAAVQQALEERRRQPRA